MCVYICTCMYTHISISIYIHMCVHAGAYVYTQAYIMIAFIRAVAPLMNPKRSKRHRIHL